MWEDVGTIETRRGTYKLETDEEIHLVALVNLLHTSVMLTNWETTRREGKNKMRRVGGELVRFKYGEIQNYYYYGRHAVNDNNKNKQGCLSFEEVVLFKDWEMR